MDVSWKWLNRYLDLSAPVDEVAERLTMSGLNHESTTAVGDDFCLDLEVTSNRADCLGHLGVAREISALYGLPLSIPDPQPPTAGEPVDTVCQVAIEAPEFCQRYTARVLRGVRVGPSPAWLVDLLQTIGIDSVNNVVDITNFVMMECGQPLHAFDLAKLKGGRIIVRDARPGETITAINHNQYSLAPGMCAIADEAGPVALGGVMGGADSEISETTTDLLIEAAWFLPASIRSTARQLNLHSDSSFRFERNVDLEGLDWASRRCAALILELAGGTLLPGVIDVQCHQPERTPITLRRAQIERVLGITIPNDFVDQALVRLGLEIQERNAEALRLLPPSWRKDLTREIDLIEEVGRLFGYDQVPENVTVPMTSSHPAAVTRIVDKVHRVMNAAGFDEAMCPSLLPEPWSSAVSPWTDQEPLVSHQPMLGVLEKGSQNVGAVACLRRTLIASLLEAKRINEYRSNADIDLYETAAVYLPTAGLPEEPLMLGMVSGRSFVEVKGVVEALCREIAPDLTLEATPSLLEVLDVSRSATLSHSGQMLGVMGQVSPGAQKAFGLRQTTVVAELNLSRLLKQNVDIRRQQPISEYPAVSRDFNFVVEEGVSWSQLESAVRNQVGETLETIRFREIFRNEKRDGAGKKRVLLSISLRSMQHTLTGPEVDAVCDQVVRGCEAALGAVLAT